MVSPVVVKTKYHFNATTGKLVGHGTAKHVDECELSSDFECVLVFKNPATFGMWKITLNTTPQILPVMNQHKTGWYLMDIPTYRAQEPMTMSLLPKSAAMPQDPPVLP